ncbi:hypothetical protein C8J56DRAFT_896652 [Mycena floridula]|nr:hypothetical protein C8J56DRAFT_896652 [Mycena floridula]
MLGNKVVGRPPPHASQALVRFNGGCDSVKGEGPVKKVAKMPKNAVYALIAKAVFTVDADSAIQEDYTVNPAKHRSTVNNSFIQLRKQYREANAKIGCTGAGLEYFQVEQDFPFGGISTDSLGVGLDPGFGGRNFSMGGDNGMCAGRSQIQGNGRFLPYGNPSFCWTT